MPSLGGAPGAASRRARIAHGAAGPHDVKGARASGSGGKLGLNATRAMAAGGMVGGGIFSTLGVVVGIAGRWVPLADRTRRDEGGLMRERSIVASIEGEYRRYRNLAEGAMAQLSEAQLGESTGAEGNSIATLVRHMAGNLESRFTGFLESDGEKPWRDREGEFQTREVPRAALLARWNAGWQVLFDALAALDDADLQRIVTIRGVPHAVHEALHRSLAHASYHVGQIVFMAKAMKGPGWRYLSIPPGGTAAYNRRPEKEKPPSTREPGAS